MRSFLVAAAVVAVLTANASAQLSGTFNETDRQKVETEAQKVLKATGVPSASVAIVMNGKIVYTGAFGLANVSPEKAAEPKMAYPIGSISKQFTATAALILQQEGKLSLDDKVSKYYPELTRANDVTLRNLMTMTSGYEDFAPQDYLIPAWYHPIEPLDNIHQWAEKPLDFEPGTAWQYSNTNYVLLGLIVQKVSGEPLYKFIRERVLTPLHMEGVFNTYTEREKLQVTGYVSNAMAAPRVLPLEATGWYFGDGDLAMPAATLATWDLGIMNQSLLTPASYQQFETAMTLKNGDTTHYGLGVFVRNFDGHVLLEHGGEVGGYVSENMVFPHEKMAIVVLTNEVASEAAGDLGKSIAKLLLPPASPSGATTASADTFAPELQKLLTQLQSGQIDRSALTSNCNAYFTPETLADFQSTLAPLGKITTVTRTATNLRGGMTFGFYKVVFSSGAGVMVNTYRMPDGKVEQLLVVGKV
jgi:D-alanyl-D-alanine carboxypeptidase